MKKTIFSILFLSLTLLVFANGIQETNTFRGQGNIHNRRYQQMLCYDQNGQFDIDLFIENSPIVASLDQDSDGIVDGTNVTVKDFILSRIDSFQPRYLSQQHGRGRRF